MTQQYTIGRLIAIVLIVAVLVTVVFVGKSLGATGIDFIDRLIFPEKKNISMYNLYGLEFNGCVEDKRSVHDGPINNVLDLRECTTLVVYDGKQFVTACDKDCVQRKNQGKMTEEDEWKINLDIILAENLFKVVNQEISVEANPKTELESEATIKLAEFPSENKGLLYFNFGQGPREIGIVVDNCNNPRYVRKDFINQVGDIYWKYSHPSSDDFINSVKNSLKELRCDKFKLTLDGKNYDMFWDENKKIFRFSSETNIGYLPAGIYGLRTYMKNTGSFFYNLFYKDSYVEVTELWHYNTKDGWMDEKKLEGLDSVASKKIKKALYDLENHITGQKYSFNLKGKTSFDSLGNFHFNYIFGDLAISPSDNFLSSYHPSFKKKDILLDWHEVLRQELIDTRNKAEESFRITRDGYSFDFSGQGKQPYFQATKDGRLRYVVKVK